MNKKLISFQIPEDVLNQLDAHIVLQEEDRDNFIVRAIAHYMECLEKGENGKEPVKIVKESDIAKLSQLSQEIKAEIEVLINRSRN